MKNEKSIMEIMEEEVKPIISKENSEKISQLNRRKEEISCIINNIRNENFGNQYENGLDDFALESINYLFDAQFVISEEINRILGSI